MRDVLRDVLRDGLRDGLRDELRDGLRDGLCNQKWPVFFFIFRYVKHFIYINLNIHKKIVLTDFMWV